eukprot:PhF_6_TR25611/c0_g1_i1/m.35952
MADSANVWKTYARIRPRFLDDEPSKALMEIDERNHSILLRMLDDEARSISINFDSVFSDKRHNDEIYEVVGRRVLEGFFGRGVAICVFVRYNLFRKSAYFHRKPRRKRTYPAIS